MSVWQGYFICSVCKHINKIKGWILVDGQHIRIELTAGEEKGVVFDPGTRGVVFVCEKCDSKFEFGLMRKGCSSYKTQYSLIDKLKRLQEENCELRRRLKYIEYMTKGMLHKDLVKIITNEEVKQK